MKIAIDVSPLSSGHRVRGVGFYLQHLQNSLTKYFPEHEYTWFEKDSQLPKKVDVVHYPYFDPFFLTLPFKRRFPTVVTVHDLTPLVFPKDFPAGFKGTLKWRLQRLVLKSVDGVITDSVNSQKDIVHLTGINIKKVSVAYLAAGEEFVRFKTQDSRIKKVKEQYKLPEKFALYVGDVTPNKNVPRIITSCIQAEIPLVMVGKALSEKLFDTTNPWNKDLVEAKRLIENAKNVFILGFVPNEDVVGLYNSATMAVMPSLYEGFGLPIVEAMQCGCPVVTSHGGSLAEVAENAAYIVDANNLESIQEGFSKVFGNNTLQKELRQKGLMQAEKFSWKKTAADTLHTYENVLGK